MLRSIFQPWSHRAHTRTPPRLHPKMNANAQSWPKTTEASYTTTAACFLMQLEQENTDLHALLDTRNTRIEELEAQVAERDATIASLGGPVYDIIAAMHTHLNQPRDLLMEECEESIAANNGDAELAAVESWVASTTKCGKLRKPHTVPADEHRCHGTKGDGERCTRTATCGDGFCKKHSNGKSTPQSSPTVSDDKEAKKAAKLAKREAKKATKLAEREANKAAKLAEREAKKATKLAEMEANKAAKLAEREAKKEAKLAEKEAKKATRKPRATPPMAIWQKENAAEIKQAVAQDTSGAKRMAIVGRLWKALAPEIQDRYKALSKASIGTDDITLQSAAALIGLATHG